MSGVNHAGALFFNADDEHSFDGDIFATNTAAATVEQRLGFVAFGGFITVGLTGGEAELELDDHSTLTLATGGHKLTFEKPIVSDGTLAVTGGGMSLLGEFPVIPVDGDHASALTLPAQQ